MLNINNKKHKTHVNLNGKKAFMEMPHNYHHHQQLTEKKLESNLITVLVVLVAQLDGHVEGITSANDERWIALVEDVVLVGAMLLGVVTLKQFHADHIVR